MNSNYFTPKLNLKAFTIKSYFDQRAILFHRKNNAEIIDFNQFRFIKTNINSIQKLKNTGLNFYTISKPIISEDKKYAILEAGIFNKKGGLPDLIHVFLYKKEKGVWKRFELITQIRM